MHKWINYLSCAPNTQHFSAHTHRPKYTHLLTLIRTRTCYCWWNHWRAGIKCCIYWWERAHWGRGNSLTHRARKCNDAIFPSSISPASFESPIFSSWENTYSNRTTRKHLTNEHQTTQRIKWNTQISMYNKSKKYYLFNQCLFGLVLCWLVCIL